mmetsp:Transcript_30882/g.102850  ORF Transcript_30882/g.102850 Transcript_30882/m.102850 type:complete len:276 (+) Transcript_30882:3-830(+)
MCICVHIEATSFQNLPGSAGTKVRLPTIRKASHFLPGGPWVLPRAGEQGLHVARLPPPQRPPQRGPARTLDGRAEEADELRHRGRAPESHLPVPDDRSVNSTGLRPREGGGQRGMLARLNGLAQGGPRRLSASRRLLLLGGQALSLQLLLLLGGEPPALLRLRPPLPLGRLLGRHTCALGGLGAEPLALGCLLRRLCRLAPAPRRLVLLLLLVRFLFRGQLATLILLMLFPVRFFFQCHPLLFLLLLLLASLCFFLCYSLPFPLLILPPVCRLFF